MGEWLAGLGRMGRIACKWFMVRVVVYEEGTLTGSRTILGRKLSNGTVS